MVDNLDIQYAAAEIRRGRKKDRRKKDRNNRATIKILSGKLLTTTTKEWPSLFCMAWLIGSGCMCMHGC